MTNEKIHWREIAENKSNDPEARVLAAAVHTAEAHAHDNLMRQLVADLGWDQTDQVMEHLVGGGLANWRVEPSTAPSGHRRPGLIKARWEGRKTLEAAYATAQKAERQAARQARPMAKVKRGFSALWRQVQAAETGAKTVLTFVALAAAFGAGAWFRGCG